MIDLLRKRRSIRKFTAQGIEPEKMDVLKEALLRSPSSRNFHPWQFVIVDDKGKLEELSRSKMSGSTLLKGAAACVVICGSEDISDVWIEDCAVAAILLQMTAQSFGLGSCWVQIRNRHSSQGVSSEDYVRKALGITDNMRVASIIALGYPAEKKEPVRFEKLAADKFHINSW